MGTTKLAPQVKYISLFFIGKERFKVCKNRPFLGEVKASVDQPVVLRVELDTGVGVAS